MVRTFWVLNRQLRLAKDGLGGVAFPYLSPGLGLPAPESLLVGQIRCNLRQEGMGQLDAVTRFPPCSTNCRILGSVAMELQPLSQSAGPPPPGPLEGLVQRRSVRWVLRVLSQDPPTTHWDFRIRLHPPASASDGRAILHRAPLGHGHLPPAS